MKRMDDKGRCDKSEERSFRPKKYRIRTLFIGENLEYTRLVVEVEYQQVLHDCTEQEKRFLVEAARALKEILRSDKR